jgi:hypothetical protein
MSNSEVEGSRGLYTTIYPSSVIAGLVDLTAIPSIPLFA